MDKSLDLILKKSLALKEQGDYPSALVILNKIKTEKIENPRFLLIYASILYLNENYIESVKYFKMLSKIKPNSELTSTGLFQSLWKCGKFGLAYKELDRFLTNNIPLEVYLVIIEEHHSLLSKKTPKFERDVINKYYNKYFNEN